MRLLLPAQQQALLLGAPLLLGVRAAASLFCVFKSLPACPPACPAAVAFGQRAPNRAGTREQGRGMGSELREGG